MTKNLVLAITGGSGVVYCMRLLEVLLATGRNVHLVISPTGKLVLEQELGIKVDLRKFRAETLLPTTEQLASDSKLRMLRAVSGVSSGASSVLSFVGKEPGKVTYHYYQDMMSGIASGSFLTAGMVICPCSMSTLATIANGTSNNLIHRAAEVHLKERRKLILVSRETPLSSVHLDNMKKVHDAGAVVMPASPGFYQEPRSIQDLVDFMVGRICDQLEIDHTLTKRWGEKKRVSRSPRE